MPIQKQYIMICSKYKFSLMQIFINKYFHLHKKIHLKNFNNILKIYFYLV